MSPVSGLRKSHNHGKLDLKVHEGDAGCVVQDALSTYAVFPDRITTNGYQKVVVYQFQLKLIHPPDRAVLRSVRL